MSGRGAPSRIPSGRRKKSSPLSLSSPRGEKRKSDIREK